MKKIVITTSFAFMSLFLVSFSIKSKDVAVYNLIDNSADLELTAQLGSFQMYERSKETADKVTWEKRHKTWNDFALFEQRLESLAIILDRN